MDAGELKHRTKLFALHVIRLSIGLPRNPATDVIARQLLRSATSVGANYRAACRARSRADFVSKIGVVEEEADESAYWLELLAAADLVPEVKVQDLLREANELVAIFVASGQTAKHGPKPG